MFSTCSRRYWIGSSSSLISSSLGGIRTFGGKKKKKSKNTRSPPPPRKPLAITSTDLIKQLRFETGAPILECRKALNASDNDLKEAQNWLRQHGVAKVTASNREATDGLVALRIAADCKSASFIQIASETDFTAKNTKFVSLVSRVAQAVLLAPPPPPPPVANDTTTAKKVEEEEEEESVASTTAAAAAAVESTEESVLDSTSSAAESVEPKAEEVALNATTKATSTPATEQYPEEFVLDQETLLQLKFVGEEFDTKTNKTVKELVEDAVVAIRENISVTSAGRWEIVDKNRDSFLIGYVHNRVECLDDDLLLAGTVAAMVELERIDPELPEVNIRAIGKKLAMHIVATPPMYLHPNEVPIAEIERERDLITAQVMKKLSSDDSTRKAVAGILRKHYESVCLSEQAHSIEESIKHIGTGMKELGVEIKRFKRLEVLPLQQ